MPQTLHDWVRKHEIDFGLRDGVTSVESSVGSQADSYDNAMAETINGLYKAELIYKRGPWKSREST